ncbi:MAG: cytochrome C oxidase assembly protein [Rhodobacteraceae bacterium]|nr:cytochrome C oxidase assembly protein [Paracoccaceae bacterium]
MSIPGTHELHVRRGRRNAVLGLVLGGFVLLVFAITLVKLSSGQSMEAFDHVLRPSLMETEK